MNNLLPLIMMMSGFNNNKGCDCETSEGNCSGGNGFSSLLPLLFLSGGFGGGCSGDSCGCKS